MNHPILHIPLFPLGILPLPGEVQGLHIFEPRYRQLLSEVEAEGKPFGIPFFSNQRQEDAVILGALVELERVVKRYPGGESDILIRCTGLFRMRNFHSKSDGKLFPSGDVEILKDFNDWVLPDRMQSQFARLMSQSDQNFRPAYPIRPFELISRLDLGAEDRLKLLRSGDTRHIERALTGMMRLRSLILQQEARKEFNFFMN